MNRSRDIEPGKIGVMRLPSTPKALLFVYLVIHAGAWTLLPAFVNHNLPLDVIEALAWRHEWQWGYEKHPPLSGWAAEVAAWCGSGHDVSLYLLSQVCIVSAMWAVAALVRDLMDGSRTLLAACLMGAVLHYTYSTPEFNVNVVQVPLWAFGFLSFWRAVRGGQLRYWVGLGVILGLAGLAKYLSIFLVLPLVLFLVLDESGRREWGRPGLYIAALIALVMGFPHVYWLWQNDFQPMRYGLSRTGTGAAGDGWSVRLLSPITFLAAQVAAASPSFLILAPLRRGIALARVESSGALYLRLIAAVPVLGMMATSLLFGFELKSMWGMPMLVALTPLVVAHINLEQVTARQLRWTVTLGTVVFLCPLGAYALEAVGTEMLKGRGKRTQFPGKELAGSIASAWSERFDRPLRVVIGDEWYAGNVAWYGTARASTRIFADRAYLSPKPISVKPQEGAAVVWYAGQEGTPAESWSDGPVEQLRRQFPELIIDQPLVLKYRTWTDVPGVVIGRAWIPPKEMSRMHEDDAPPRVSSAPRDVGPDEASQLK